MTQMTYPAASEKVDAGLRELSRLHLAYEQAADPNYFGDHSGDAEAAELSAAVGRFLIDHGYDGVA